MAATANKLRLALKISVIRAHLPQIIYFPAITVKIGVIVVFFEKKLLNTKVTPIFTVIFPIALNFITLAPFFTAILQPRLQTCSVPLD
jgi:hypothetical protein